MGYVLDAMDLGDVAILGDSSVVLNVDGVRVRVSVAALNRAVSSELDAAGVDRKSVV